MLLTLFMSVPSMAEPPTEYLEAGEEITVTVPSLLIPEARARELLALATVGKACDEATQHLVVLTSSLEACSDERSALASASSSANTVAAKMKRQRDASLIVAGVSVIVTGSVLAVSAL